MKNCKERLTLPCEGSFAARSSTFDTQVADLLYFTCWKICERQSHSLIDWINLKNPKVSSILNRVLQFNF